MTVEDRPDALRGWLGNTLVWGVGWFTLALLAMVAFALLGAVGIIPAFTRADMVEAFIIAVRVAIVGTVAGGAFSAVIRLVYRGRNLSDISWVRFGLGGGLVTGVFVPLFLQTMNLLSYQGMVPWGQVLDDGVLTAVIGGIAAGASIKVAQISDAVLTSGTDEEVPVLEGDDPLGVGEG